MKRRLLLTIVLSLAVGVTACGDDPEPAGNNGNNGIADAGTDGGGTEDGGTEDGGTEDGGTEDGGTEDGGTEDGGTDGGTTALNAVTADDQALAGATSNQVTIASVTLEEDGFVVIHEDDGGSPGGTILGNERVVAGDATAGVTVTLDRDATNGETLHAMLHGDTNGNETYDFTGAGSEDGPVLDDNDAAVTDSFVVNVPSVTASDLTITDLSTVVTVDSAFSNGAGWLVIHEDACGDGGGVLGQTALADGENTDVSVTLEERPAADGESLCAMLHADTGVAGEYEFGDGSGEDAPVTLSDGSVVVDTFAVTLDGDVPAIRITLSSNGSQNYLVDSVEPAFFDNGLSGVTDDPDFEFLDGWRYEINNTVLNSNHPFEFLGGVAVTDAVLSQDSDGSAEGNAAVNWQEDGDSIFFTIAGPFTRAAGAIDSYQCSSHNGMTGSVTVITP
jgi:hypothetical protein